MAGDQTPDKMNAKQSVLDQPSPKINEVAQLADPAVQSEHFVFTFVWGITEKITHHPYQQVEWLYFKEGSVQAHNTAISKCFLCHGRHFLLT